MQQTAFCRVLHSFPTRRSSDLGNGRAILDRPRTARRDRAAGHLAGTGKMACSTVPPRGPRSEEHTSELQSRLHLVYRLLLEKKKFSFTNNLHTTNHDEH